jgi:uncharacterized protein (DUF488 family)
MPATKRKKSSADPAVLPERQRQLLLLLNALGGRVSDRDFATLLFRYCQELAAGVLYEFVPSASSPRSFTAEADRRKLVEREVLAAAEDEWRLTGEGPAAVGAEHDLVLDAFVQRETLRGDALAADTHRRFPEYAPGHVHRKKSRAPLSTIGYEGRSLEGYLNLLLRHGVTLLCDVRRNPFSRKWGFSKNTLAMGCEAVGIRYENLPELGIAAEKRHAVESDQDRDALFADYERHTLPQASAAIDRIRDWIGAGERVALTCYELDPGDCHRSRLAAAVVRRVKLEGAVHL